MTAFAFTVSAFAADSGVFLSLTRKAEDIASLPTNVSTISGSDIAEKHARNLGEALQSELGFNINQYGTLGSNSNITIRGSKTEQVLVLIDGRRINDIALGLVDLSSIPTDNIKRIEVIRGAASAIYGANAFGGVINVITEKADEAAPVATLAARSGSFGEQTYSSKLNLNKNERSLLVTLEKQHLDGWRQNSDYNNINSSLRLGLNTSRYGNFDFSSQILNSELGIPGGNFSADPNTFTDPTAASSPRARQKENNRYARMENTFNTGEHSLKTSIYGSNDSRDYSDPDSVLDARYGTMVFGGQEQYTGPYNITAGTEWWEEQYKQTDLELSEVVLNKSRVNTDIFLQRQTFVGKFMFLPGLRFDSNSSFGSEACPSLSVVYKQSDSFKISANTGKAWRAPTFSDLYFPMDAYGDVGNPALKPEEGISSDLGVEVKSGKTSVSVTGFRTDNRNLISWVPNSTGMLFSPQNINTSRSSGIEAGFDQTLAAGLAHSINYTYLWAEDTDTKQVLIYSPCNTLNYQINWLMPCGTLLGISAKYVSQQMATATTTLNDYTTIGAQLSHNFENIDIWVKGSNLTDRKYVTRQYYPLPGATWQAGVTYKFWN